MDKIEPASPFIDTRRGGIHAQEIAEVVVFSLNRRGAVVEHCRKCTMGYDVRRGSHPGHLMFIFYWPMERLENS